MTGGKSYKCGEGDEDDSPLKSFVIYTVEGESVTSLLRRCADEIDALGHIEVLGIGVDQELRAADMPWKASVYWYKSARSKV